MKQIAENNLKKIDIRLPRYGIPSKEKRSDMLQCAVKFIVFGLSGFLGIGSVTSSILHDDILAVFVGVFGGVLAVLLLFTLEKRINKNKRTVAH